MYALALLVNKSLIVINSMFRSLFLGLYTAAGPITEYWTKTRLKCQKTMDLQAVCLLCQEQGDRSLEDHTRDSLEMAVNCPREEFAAFVEWVLVKK